jgi:hypothetical protein
VAAGKSRSRIAGLRNVFRDDCASATNTISGYSKKRGEIGCDAVRFGRRVDGTIVKSLPSFDLAYSGSPLEFPGETQFFQAEIYRVAEVLRY